MTYIFQVIHSLTGTRVAVVCALFYIRITNTHNTIKGWKIKFSRFDTDLFELCTFICEHVLSQSETWLYFSIPVNPCTFNFFVSSLLYGKVVFIAIFRALFWSIVNIELMICMQTFDCIQWFQWCPTTLIGYDKS